MTIAYNKIATMSNSLATITSVTSATASSMSTLTSTISSVDSVWNNAVTVMVDQKAVLIPRDELVKYIRERELRESSDLVRTLWDRYQVAVKLVGSKNDGKES